MVFVISAGSHRLSRAANQNDRDIGRPTRLLLDESASLFQVVDQPGKYFGQNFERNQRPAITMDNIYCHK